jgi:hypothetical protein
VRHIGYRVSSQHLPWSQRHRVGVCSQRGDHFRFVSSSRRVRIGGASTNRQPPSRWRRATLGRSVFIGSGFRLLNGLLNQRPRLTGNIDKFWLAIRITVDGPNIHNSHRLQALKIKPVASDTLLYCAATFALV